jgi:hypothetical protein
MRSRAKVERRGLLMTDINLQIDEAAGHIWQTLSEEGPQTVAQLRKKMKVANEIVPFAIWRLAFEDKIELAHEKKGLRIQLK